MTIKWICEHISQNWNCLRKISAKSCHHIRCILSWSIGIEKSSHVLNLQLNIFPRSIFCSFEMKMFQEMSSPTCLLCFISTSTFNKNWNAEYWLNNLDILESISSEATVIPLFVLDKSLWINFYEKDENDQELGDSLLIQTFSFLLLKGNR